jgi:hypothetical protein
LEQQAQVHAGEVPAEVIGIPLAPAAQAQLGALRPTSPPLWPTPAGTTGGQNDETPENWEARRERKTRENPNLGDLMRPLGVAAQQWQTMTTLDAAGRDYTYPKGNHDAPFLTLTGQAKQGSKRKLNVKFVSWLQGFPVDWVAEVPRVDGLRAMGNAVVPAQAAYAIRLLWAELERHAEQGHE